MAEQKKDSQSEIDAYVTGMKVYSSVMKSVVALSTTMLVFPLTFLTAMNQSAPIQTNCWLFGAWFILVVSMLSGIFYQAIAAKKIFAKLGNSPICKCLDQPYLTFWSAMICLFFGVLLLVLGLIVSLAA